MSIRLRCVVNGEAQEVDDVWQGESLLYVLRERMGLPGAKNACEQGECGSCTVYLDGTPVCSCLVAAGQAEGREVVTVEGLADDGRLDPVQEAFVDAGAVQCGFCTPGLIVATHDLLHRRPDPTDSEVREALAGNLCRCTGYQQILDAVHRAAARRVGTPRGDEMTAPLTSPPTTRGIEDDAPGLGTVGHSVRRPDAVPKVRGEFEYSSDLSYDGMLWGATVRSPHPHAEITGVDFSAALAVPGVVAVLTAADVPGPNRHGLERRDQPVLAADRVRYVGEPVAIVAADHPETARRAVNKVRVAYTPLPVVTDPEAALTQGVPRLHEDGNLIRHMRIRRGTPQPTADVVVTGEYQVGRQDQAFLGPESCLALPGTDGGIDLRCSTQWLHIDQDQLADCLALPKEKVRLTLAGVGGAFGGREDLSVQAHASLLALHTGRPVKMMYGREESFVGHVHRHPARMWFEHGATHDGRLVYVKARIILDGGAYASTSAAVVGNAGCFASGPYEVDNVEVDCSAVYTNNPPCGAMRGFGAVQVCFGYESQMDKLAAALRMDPVKLRVRNAVSTGSVMATGQRVNGPAPVAELLRRVARMPLPAQPADSGDVTWMPGGAGNVSHGEGIRRGIGYGVSVKNICKSAGYDDVAHARVRVQAAGANVRAQVHTAAAEVGQGLVTVQAQIVRTELGIEDVDVLPADTNVGDAGTSSASRQTWMSGGAIQVACATIRQRLLDQAASLWHEPPSELRLRDGAVVSTVSGRATVLAHLLRDGAVEETAVYRHRPTEPLDPDTGQGDAHVAYAFAAHRAVVDVDTELGLVRVVEIACAEDVGKAINPVAVEGQMQGGIAQGLGLALMEELLVEDGRIRNSSFTDYLIPTTLDMPATRLDILEMPRSDSPYGLTGVGEPALLSAPAAIAAAVRDATGVDITRIPIHPWLLCDESRLSDVCP